MEDKRKDLKSTKQRELISRITAKLSEINPSLYYLATVQIAAEIKDYINQPGNLSRDDYQLLKDLRRRDIQIMLSLH